MYQLLEKGHGRKARGNHQKSLIRFEQSLIASCSIRALSAQCPAVSVFVSSCGCLIHLEPCLGNEWQSADSSLRSE
jgi:hypothetical protein